MQNSKKLKPKPDVARDFGVTTRSIDRWVEMQALGFPRPVKINTRCYFDVDALEAWKSSRLRQCTGEAAAEPRREGAPTTSKVEELA